MTIKLRPEIVTIGDIHVLSSFFFFMEANESVCLFALQNECQDHSVHNMYTMHRTERGSTSGRPAVPLRGSGHGSN